MIRLLHDERDTLVRLALAAFISWFFIAAIFFVSGLDWIEDTDSGWYWSIAEDLLRFDPAVTIGFPLIWRGLAEAFPFVSPNILGQIASLCAYVVMVPVIYMILVELEIPFAPNATLLIIFFPLVGVTYSVFPRVNSLLRLIVFVAILAYLRNWTWTLVLSLAVLPLFHRSILLTVGIFVLIGLWERRLRWWMLLPMSLPLAFYWSVGALKNDDLLWYLEWYKKSDDVLGLPIADGLFGTLVLGFRGSIADLIQGAIVLGYWLLAVVLLFSRSWKPHPILLGLILPVIVLGLMQPEEEIWSMYHYTTYSVIPLVVYLQHRGYAWLQKTSVWLIVLSGLLLSQVAWVIYTIHYYG